MIPSNLLHSIIRNRELILEMAVRDIKGAGKGAMLGVLWLVISPLVQTAAYVVIVSFVFGARLGGGAGTFDYALYVLAGMVPWHIMTRSLQESPSLIRERMELVKQVIYPIETLPLTSLLASSLSSLVVLGILLILSLLSGSLKASVLLLPVPAALLLLFLLGVSWVFSIAGVLLKDLREIVALVLALMVYVSPVLLSESMVGKELWAVVLFNPLAHIVICFRDVLQGGFHAGSWAAFVVMAATAFAIGAWVMSRTKTLINEYI